MCDLDTAQSDSSDHRRSKGDEGDPRPHPEGQDTAQKAHAASMERGGAPTGTLLRENERYG